MSLSTILLLQEYKDKKEIERRHLGIPFTEDNLVFCKIDGKPLTPNTVTHAWNVLVVKTGLKPIRLHDARHTHASIMLKAGTHPKIVQERLEYSSIATALDVYSHVTPGLQEAAAERFENSINFKPDGIRV